MVLISMVRNPSRHANFHVMIECKRVFFRYILF